MSMNPRVNSCAVALLAVAGCITPPTQTYRSTYQNVRTGNEEITSWSNLAEFGVQEQAGPGLEYRLTDRIIDTQTRSSGPDTETVLHQPSLDLIFTAGALTWLQGYELQEDRSLVDGAPDNELQRREMLHRFDWVPVGLPRLTGWVDFRTLEDDRFVDQESVETLVEVSEVRGPIEYIYSLEDEQTDDLLTDQEIDRREHRFRAAYREQSADGRLSTTLSVFGEERSVITRSPTSTLAPTPVFPIAGLSVVDTTPQISVLAPNAALIDNDDTTSAGIDIGGFASGGQLDVNMGVELLPGSIVDTIDLVTVTPVDPLQAPDFNFSVWVSNDNNFWTLVTPSALFVYEQAFRRFRLTIPQVTDQFVKIVNTTTSPAAPSVFVSELRVFRTVLGPASSKFEVEDSIRNAAWNVSWRMHDDFLLTYDILLQASETESGGNRTRDETRVDNSLSALWTPREDVDVSALGELRKRNDSIQLDEETVLVNGRTIYRPLDTLDITLNYTRTDRKRESQGDLSTWATQLGASAQLLETLEAEVTAEVNSQDDEQNLRVIDRRVVTASLLAEMTPELEMIFGFRKEESDVSGANAGLIPNPSEDRYEMTAIYQPNDRVTADAQLEWKDTFSGQGLDQRYRLDWLPFQDGALNMQLNYDRIETRSSVDERIDSYQVLTRWSFDPNVLLEINYAVQVPDRDDRTDIVTVAFRATL